MSVEVQKIGTKKFVANQEQVNVLVRSLINKVTELKDDVTRKDKEIEHLKSKAGDANQDWSSAKKTEDDLDTDGASPNGRSHEMPTRESFGHQEKRSIPTGISGSMPLKSGKQSRDVACSTDIMPVFTSLDHSSCCSREISLKLVEQNKALQKKLREILNLSGSSIEEYLKSSYNEDRLNSKIREIEQLKKQLDIAKKDNHKNNLEMNEMKKKLEEKDKQIITMKTLLAKGNNETPEVQKIISSQKPPPPCLDEAFTLIGNKATNVSQTSLRHTGDHILETDGSKDRFCPNCEKKFPTNKIDEFKKHVQKCWDV